MPDLAEERRLAKADGRYFTVESQQATAYDGTVAVHGQLDLADAIALEDAIQVVAAELKDLGSTESLDVRRSQAVGELARRQLSFDLVATDRWLRRVAPRPSRNHPKPKPKHQVVALRPHLAGGTVRSTRCGPGRTRQRTWSPPATCRTRCNVADQVTVKPVLDLPTRHWVVATVRDQTAPT